MRSFGFVSVYRHSNAIQRTSEWEIEETLIIPKDQMFAGCENIK